MAIWINNLKRALCEKEVVILHGNVRDIYVDREEKAIYKSLADLLQHVLRTSSERPDQVIFYDPVDQIQGGASRQDDLTPSGYPNHQANDLADTLPAQRPSPEPVELAMVLQDYRETLARPEARTALVLPHLDKTIARKSTYQSDDEEHILRLQKLIDVIQSPNRLILVAIQDSMIPVELYTHAPRVRLVAVPLPDKEDRVYYLNHQLGGRVSRDLLDLSADLTDGLYLYDLQNIASDLGEEINLDTIRVRELVNQYRVGFKEDYFGKLPLDELIGAPSWFTDKAGVKGQNYAVTKVCQALWVARAGLAGGSKPKAVFFFAGPTGVGKTFLARSLAAFLFKSEESLIRFDMSEFKEEHTISKLIGSPPGYVGFTEGGALTNAVREKPFSVILFDEVEKAHARVLDIFLQILDEGRLSDSHGQTVFFSEAIIIFTSNIGSEPEKTGQIEDSYKGEERRRRLREHYVAAVERYFMHEIARPELLNRIGNNIIPFNHIDDPRVMLDIVRKQLEDIRIDFDRSHQHEGWVVCFDSSVERWLVVQYKEAIKEFGGRSIGNAIQATIIPELARSVLLAEREGRHSVQFTVVSQEGRIRVNVAHRSSEPLRSPHRRAAK